MNKIFQIDTASKRKYFYKILIQMHLFYLILIVGVIIYDNEKNFVNIVEIVVGIYIAWSILQLIPLLLLYFNHYYHNKTVVLTYDDTQNNLRYHSSKRDFIFSMDDIEKVELFLAPNAFEKIFDWQYIGKYHYSKIYTKTHEVINISCLVCDMIKDIIPKELIKKKKKFIPIIKNHNKEN